MIVLIVGRRDHYIVVLVVDSLHCLDLVIAVLNKTHTEERQVLVFIYIELSWFVVSKQPAGLGALPLGCWSHIRLSHSEPGLPTLCVLHL